MARRVLRARDVARRRDRRIGGRGRRVPRAVVDELARLARRRAGHRYELGHHDARLPARQRQRREGGIRERHRTPVRPDRELRGPGARPQEVAPRAEVVPRQLPLEQALACAVVEAAVAVTDVAVRRCAGGEDARVEAGRRAGGPGRGVEGPQRAPCLPVHVAVAEVVEAELDARQARRRGRDAGRPLGAARQLAPEHQAAACDAVQERRLRGVVLQGDAVPGDLRAAGQALVGDQGATTCEGCGSSRGSCPVRGSPRRSSARGCGSSPPSPPAVRPRRSGTRRCSRRTGSARSSACPSSSRRCPWCRSGRPPTRARPPRSCAAGSAQRPPRRELRKARRGPRVRSGSERPRGPRRRRLLHGGHPARIASPVNAP